MFFLPAGGFVAPASTAEGRALNRRVEIELVTRRPEGGKHPRIALADTLP